MKINKELVLALRKERSWSQEELATAAGLNLRTVQRIENGGAASLQSRKALAAAFNVEVGDLDQPEEVPMPTRFEYRVIPFEMKLKGTKVLTDFAAIERQINALGAEGWELVKVSELLNGTTMTYVLTAALVATFKRPLE